MSHHDEPYPIHPIAYTTIDRMLGALRTVERNREPQPKRYPVDEACTACWRAIERGDLEVATYVLEEDPAFEAWDLSELVDETIGYIRSYESRGTLELTGQARAAFGATWAYELDLAVEPLRARLLRDQDGQAQP